MLENQKSVLILGTYQRNSDTEKVKDHTSLYYEYENSYF